MGALRRVYRGQNDIDFPKVTRITLVFSLVLVVASIVSLATRQLNLAIEFEGGTVWEIPTASMTTDEATDVLADADRADGAKVQELTDGDGNRILRVQAESSDVQLAQEIAGQFAETAGIDRTDVGVNAVGPSWGAEITRQALKSLIVFLVLIGLYIAWQLEWRMALAALIAVAHDVIITMGLYSILGFEVAPATVISFLTILGYSLYDTIVVYDRVQENAAKYDRSGQFTYSAIMRRSMNQVMMRSVNTGVVSLLPVSAMLIVGVWIFDQPVIRDFSLALFLGQICGIYSSIFVAAPVVVWFKERESKYKRVRGRAEERGTLETADHIPMVGAGAARSVSHLGEGSVATAQVQANKAAQYQRAHPPRPRKQGKRR